jgi:hypothetical protein
MPDDDPKTYTQEEFDEALQKAVTAEVEKTAAKIRADERKKVGEKFADYDDLKAKAAGATTLEDRVAEIERQAKDSEARAMRAEVANAKGLTPTQAKRLVGATREELEADADELLKDIGTQKKHGNHVPREGNNPKSGGSDELSEFTKNLFGRAAAD